MRSESFAKMMKIFYVFLAIFGLVVMSNGKKHIQILEQNPIAIEFNDTVDDNYKVTNFSDTTTSLELERGLISQDYTITAKKEMNEEDYINISNKLISLIKNEYSNERVSNVTINIVKKKGNISLYTRTYSLKK